MDTNSVFQRARPAWPLALLTLAFLVGLAAGGVGGAVLAVTLAFLAVGPAYLLRKRSRRRSGLVPPPQPTTPAEQAHLFRALVVFDLVAALGALAAATERGDWLPGRGWTAGLVVMAVCSAGNAPYIWAAAALLETGRTDRRALAAAGAVDLLVGLGFLGAAAANHWTDWLGGGRWTLGLAALGACWLVLGAGCLAQLRANRS